MAHSKISHQMIDTPILGYNYIINGNFDHWQRGTTQIGGGYASVDRFVLDHNVTTKTASKQTFTFGQTEVPGDPINYLRHVVTSVAGSNSYCNMGHRIESVKTLADKKVTLSFYAKADAVKNIAIEFAQYFGTGGSPSALVTGIGAQKIALTTAWKRYVITVDIPSINGKTLGTSNSDYLAAVFWFDAGTGFNSRTASLGQQSGTFDIACVSLVEGDKDIKPIPRSYTEEWELCLRYYEIIYDISMTNATNGVWHVTYIPFTVRKRTTPVITSTQNGAGNNGFPARTPGTLNPAGCSWGAAATTTVVGAGWSDNLFVDAEL